MTQFKVYPLQFVYGIRTYLIPTPVAKSGPSDFQILQETKILYLMANQGRREETTLLFFIWFHTTNIVRCRTTECFHETSHLRTELRSRRRRSLPRPTVGGTSPSVLFRASHVQKYFLEKGGGRATEKKSKVMIVAILIFVKKALYVVLDVTRKMFDHKRVFARSVSLSRAHRGNREVRCR